MIVISITVIIYVTIGILAVTVLGLIAALISKAARDRREKSASDRFDRYSALVRHPAAITGEVVDLWGHGTNADWDSLVRVTRLLSATPGARCLRDLRQRDTLADYWGAELSSKDPVRRGLALLLLGCLGRPEDSDLIAEFAYDPDGDVRLCSIRALDEIATKEAFATLLHLLHPDTTHAVTPLAEARIVERLAHPWAWPYLRPALLERRPGSDGAPESTAAIPLTYAHGNRQAIALMRAIALSDIDIAPDDFGVWLEEGTVDEKVAAVRALAARSTELPSELAMTLSDESPVVRAQAVRGITEVHVPAEMRQAIIGQLTQAITDRDWWVRGYAAASLASLGDHGRAALEHVALGDDPFAAVRAQEQLALDRRTRDVV